MLILACLQTVLIISLAVITLTKAFNDLYIPLFMVTLGSTLLLFYLGYPTLKALVAQLKMHSIFSSLIVQSHFALHSVILMFVIQDQLYKLGDTAMLIFSPVFAFFFMTAIISWRACFSVLHSKIYKIFVTGSTALFVWSIVLISLGLLYQPHFLFENLHTLMLIYFAIHFAELGFVLIKIKHDLTLMSSN